MPPTSKCNFTRKVTFKHHHGPRPYLTDRRGIAASAVIAAVARIPCVSAFSAHQLPPSPSPGLADGLSRPSALEDAKAESRSLRQRLAAADEALDARDLELQGTRATLQCLREAHVDE
ncbi:hypothetical protein ISF_02920 [Cordyceps fumosorosea ARSEF 2679]|uniref:Uncharacterized protein n=1 Tax=Cordyceps fumosorosea (strain ARSEF 2679) TaxID=1081104 RepID=A0A168B5L6_CORFA|nr:hypothetical protein ISF_02920 [Cordyceps fumosorosea ARSEF 2679]OAA69650.1 hypothetical protein ISF_02920 [Cordyceps fumosorosea ARSEF 2679]